MPDTLADEQLRATIMRQTIDALRDELAATQIELAAKAALAQRLARLLMEMHRLGGLGIDRHAEIVAALKGSPVETPQRPAPSMRPQTESERELREQIASFFDGDERFKYATWTPLEIAHAIRQRWDVPVIPPYSAAGGDATGATHAD